MNILLDMDDMWEKSAEYRLMPLNTDEQTYRQKRDMYKAQRIYSLYGYDFFSRFIKERPHLYDLLDNYVPCNREPHQCTIFCHKYNKEKGCMLCQQVDGSAVRN